VVPQAEQSRESEHIAIPEQVPNMRKLVWDVLHISEENRVLIVKGKIHHYTNDQFFLCPDCPGTAYLGDETLAYGTTAMWVVQRGQEYHQPHGPLMEGKYMNANWLAYVLLYLTQ
jgi:hypothetical protein